MHRAFPQAKRVAFLVVLLTGAGCNRDAAPPASEPPVVSVSLPVSEKVTEYSYDIGRIAAPDSVEVRSRVTGYLDKVFFKEGAEVKKKDPLFEIDQRPYKAQLNKAEGDLLAAKATAKAAALELDRQQGLWKKNATSKKDLDNAIAAADQGAASVKSAEAAVEQAQLNFDYTTIIAEVDGKTSTYKFTIGNLITGDQTVLTTLVSVDPMYAYFDVNENTILRIKSLIRAGKMKSANEAQVPCELALADSKGYPFSGTINFVDNQLNPNTGTLRVRATFPNKQRLLIPNYFCRVRVPLGEPREALLVSDRAVNSDQGQKFLLLVDSKDTVQAVPVTLGPLANGLRVIEDGLKADDRVIVAGQLRVRPGFKVSPKEASMFREPDRAPGDGVPAAKEMPIPKKEK